jgi:hypothetical protein
MEVGEQSPVAAHRLDSAPSPGVMRSESSVIEEWFHWIVSQL